MFGCMQGEWRNAKQGEAVSWKEQEETRCHELWLAYMSTLSLTPQKCVHSDAILAAVAASSSADRSAQNPCQWILEHHICADESCENLMIEKW
jgi:hypothetical protein